MENCSQIEQHKTILNSWQRISYAKTYLLQNVWVHGKWDVTSHQKQEKLPKKYAMPDNISITEGTPRFVKRCMFRSMTEFHDWKSSTDIVPLGLGLQNFNPAIETWPQTWGPCRDQGFWGHCGPGWTGQLWCDNRFSQNWNGCLSESDVERIFNGVNSKVDGISVALWGHKAWPFAIVLKPRRWHPKYRDQKMFIL